VAVVIPAYNEAQNILRLINKLRVHLPKAYIFVVDGGSVDKTGSLVKTKCQKDKRLYLLPQKTKAGRGKAVQMGLKRALQIKGCQYFVEMDADLSHQVQDVLKLLKAVTFKNIIIASRYVSGAKIINWPAWRLRQSRLANTLIRLVLGLKLNDNTNGLRCYPRQAAEILARHHYLSYGFMALSESAYLLKRSGFNLVEVPSTFRDRRYGKSSAGYKELLSSLLNLFQIRFSSLSPRGWYGAL